MEARSAYSDQRKSVKRMLCARRWEFTVAASIQMICICHENGSRDLSAPRAN